MAPVRILVYSDDAHTREQVRLALGERPHPSMPTIDYIEVATPMPPAGLAKQLKDEIADCPPILVLTGRPDDAWLASWSRAEASVPQPIDPIELASTVIALLRRQLSQ